MFEPWAKLLLDQLALRSGEAVLDVACGPGSVSRLAAARVGPTGRVTGCDLSPAMLQLAKAKPTLATSAPVEYIECPADALTVAATAYDVVTCQQGLQFFPDRMAALHEMVRALRGGGRVGIAVWCAIDDCPPFAGLAMAIAEVLGDEVAETYRNGPWGFADGGEVGGLVAAAGFTDVRVERYTLPVVFSGGPAQLLQTLAAASVASMVEQLDESGQRALALQ
jgi:SAM-dependent methyltransferase